MHKRIIGLDILRVWAILLVVFGHVNHFFPKELRPYSALPHFIDGVSIFFVLSGFLIGRIIINQVLLKSKTKFKDFKTFILRRWFRTLPLYFTILIVLIVFDFKNWNNDFSFFIFSQNLFSGQSSFFSVSWSLSVEEWFYLSLPLVLYTLSRFIKLSRFYFLIVVILFILVPFIFRYYRCLEFSYLESFDNNIRKVVLYRIDSIMYGVLSAYLFTFHNNYFKRYKNKWFVISFVILSFLFLRHINGWFGLNFHWLKFTESKEFKFLLQFNIESWAVFFLLPFFYFKKDIKYIYIRKIVLFISKVSYSLYLIHGVLVLDIIFPFLKPLLLTLELRFEIYTFLTLLLYFSLSFLLSFFTYRYIEMYFLFLRDKYIKEK